MKKLFLVVCLLFAVSVVNAERYHVALSTHTPTTEQGQTDGDFPLIENNAKVGNVIISNDGDVAQTITIYEQSSSSTTATVAAVAVIDSTGTISIDLGYEQVNDLSVIKSDTGSNVNVTIITK